MDTVDKTPSVQFWKAMVRILPNKILEKLCVLYELKLDSDCQELYYLKFVQHVLKGQELRFKKIFIQEEHMPDLVWNHGMRSELEIGLQRQMNDYNLHKLGFTSRLATFTYEIVRKELMVGNVFLRYFVADKYAKPDNMV